MIRAAIAQAETLFDHLQVQNRQPRHVGRLVSHDAGMLEVTGFRRPIGAGARVIASDGTIARAEVVVVSGLLAWVGRRDLVNLSRSYQANIDAQERSTQRLEQQAWIRSGQGGCCV